MNGIKTKMVREYIDDGNGFPVLLKNVTMRWLQGDWVADINYNWLDAETVLFLARKPARLTGVEVRFLRHRCEMTYQKFADLFGVAPQAVMKWEKAGAKPTRMAWTTEKDLRLTVLERAGVSRSEFMDAFRTLREAPKAAAAAPLTLDLKKRPRARRSASVRASGVSAATT
jgi:DNA-binding transcriptional regulator YiaG